MFGVILSHQNLFLSLPEIKVYVEVPESLDVAPRMATEIAPFRIDAAHRPQYSQVLRLDSQLYLSVSAKRRNNRAIRHNLFIHSRRVYVCLSVFRHLGHYFVQTRSRLPLDLDSVFLWPDFIDIQRYREMCPFGQF